MVQTKNYRVVTETQWRNLNQKLNNLQAQLLFLEQNLPRREKRYLKFDECVPPVSICKDVVSMLKGVSTYEGAIGRLCEYYGCPIMDMKVDPGDKVAKNCLAVYYPDLKTAYSAGQTIDEHTVFHEFFHHLVAHKVVIVNDRAAEHWANKYADVLLERANS